MAEEKKEQSKAVLQQSSSSLRGEEEAVEDLHEVDEENLTEPTLRRSGPAIHRAVASPGAYLSSSGISRRAASVAYHSLFQRSASHHPDAEELGTIQSDGDAPAIDSFHPVATMIPELLDIPIAEELRDNPEQEQENKNALRVRGALLLALTIVGISVGLAVGLSLRDHDTLHQNEGSADTHTLPPTTMSPESHFLALLPNHTQTALDRPTSPQAHAFQWLVGDLSFETYSPSRQLTRFALATLYYATKGDTAWKETTHWLDYDQHECSWFVTVVTDPLHTAYYQPLQPPPCDNDGVYRELWLIDNGLRGTLPEELYLLTSLRSLMLYRNELTGTLSTRIGDWTSLVGLGLFMNDLSGTIPSQVGFLHDSLDGLFTFYNPRLSGSIPTEVGTLTHLKNLILEGCAMTGTIPSEIGALTYLKELKLNQNELVGSLPTELGNLQSVDTVNLYRNMLTGPLPSELGTMSSLLWVALRENAITGTIPTTLGRLSQLQSLWFHSNQLTGAVPSELGLLSDLKKVFLNSNALTGTLSSEMSLLGITAPNLLLFNVSDTLLSGEMPPELCPLETLVFDCSVSLCGCDCPCE